LVGLAPFPSLNGLDQLHIALISLPLSLSTLSSTFPDFAHIRTPFPSILLMMFLLVHLLTSLLTCQNGKLKQFWTRHCHCRVQYLVKWVGYPETEATWEPKRNLRNALRMIEDYEAQQPLDNHTASS